MQLFKSGNPTLTEKYFNAETAIDRQDAMTAQGTLTKFGVLLLMMMGTAAFTWKAYYSGVNTTPWMLTGAIGGLIVALVIIFKSKWAPFLAPAYGLLEGLFVGGISAMFNYAYDGIVLQAVALTFGVAMAMYLLYNFRIIKVTEKFRSIIFIATAGIALFYLISFVMSFFGVTIPFIHEGTTFGIIFSLVVVTIAALNLLLDFDMIEKGVESGAPKHMEWYGAFGLLVTIIWLYIEMLRLLSKINSRN